MTIFINHLVDKNILLKGTKEKIYKNFLIRDISNQNCKIIIKIYFKF